MNEATVDDLMNKFLFKLVWLVFHAWVGGALLVGIVDARRFLNKALVVLQAIITCEVQLRDQSQWSTLMT